MEPKGTQVGWMAPDETLPVLRHRASLRGVTGSRGQAGHPCLPRPPHGWAPTLPRMGWWTWHRGVPSWSTPRECGHTGLSQSPAPWGSPLTWGSNSPRGGRRVWREPRAPRPRGGSGGRCCSGCCPGGAGGSEQTWGWRCHLGQSECPLPVPSTPGGVLHAQEPESSSAHGKSRVSDHR